MMKFKLINSPPILLNDLAYKIHSIREENVFTLAELLQFRAHFEADKTAYVFVSGNENETKITYSDLDSKAKKIASLLLTKVSSGDVSLLLYPPGLEFIEAFFGCIYAGVIAVPFMLPKSQRHIENLRRVLADSQSKLVLTTQSVSSRSELFKDISELVSVVNTNCEIGATNNFIPQKITSDSIAFLQYTSGSTSAPKGVIATHKTILHNQKMIKFAFGHSKDTVVLGWSPHFHDQGLIGNILQPLYLGCTCILIAPIDFFQNPLLWLKLISKYRVTTSGGPNFAYDLCVNKITESACKGLDLSCWKVAYNGAERVRNSTIDLFCEKFQAFGFQKKSFYPVYGLAEAMVFSAGSKVDEEPEFFELVAEQRREFGENEHQFFGKIALYNSDYLDQDIQIVNPKTGDRILDGQIGEVWISGPNVSNGYWNNAELSKKSFYKKIIGIENKAYLKSGDLGIKVNNKLGILGRLKETIVIKGKNYFPEDIELGIESLSSQIVQNGVAAFAYTEFEEEYLVVAVEVTRHTIRNKNFIEIVQKIQKILKIDFGVTPLDIVLLKPHHLPRTSSGKIQRIYCKNLYKNLLFNQEPQLQFVFRSFELELEKKLQQGSKNYSKVEIRKVIFELWAEHLECSNPSGDKSFNNSGGTSLVAVDFSLKMDQIFGVKLPSGQITDSTTIDSLTEAVYGLMKYDLAKKSKYLDYVVRDNESKVKGKINSFNSFVQFETRSLITQIASRKLEKPNVIGLVTLPDKLRSVISQYALEELLREPVLVSMLKADIGNVGILTLPIYSSELSNPSLDILNLIKDTLMISEFLKAEIVCLTGTIPASFGYGETILSKLKNKPFLPSITTGHVTTVVSVVMSILEMLSISKRSFKNETMGFLGLGSIGAATLKSLLALGYYPKSVILCDRNNARLKKIEGELFSYGFSGKTVLLHTEIVPTEFYNATFIVGAAGSGELLDVEQLNPGTLIVDDSFPKIANAFSLEKRLKRSSDILFTEAGLIRCPFDIYEIRSAVFEDRELKKALPALFSARKSTDLTSCILSGLLSFRYPEFECKVGEVSPSEVLAHLQHLKNMGYTFPGLAYEHVEIAHREIDGFVLKYGSKC